MARPSFGAARYRACATRGLAVRGARPPQEGDNLFYSPPLEGESRRAPKGEPDRAKHE